MIYICIPTHNEQQTIGVVLWKLRQVLTDYPRDYQLLVGDDASTDKTGEVLEPYTRVLPLTVIRSEQRQGYAATLEMLLREAVRRSEYPKRDSIVTLQADFSEEPDDLVPLVKRLEAGADVAVGNKVSETRPTRARRFARALASFFARGQTWPEGVVTPFESYRAYRLHAVKHAIEERDGGRLIRHEGWAAHAQLLRQVQPHARRIDVVDIVDRTDRLQRPRRENPLAAALAVRVMVRGAEPQGLTGVEELDRLAATGSRSRDRNELMAQVRQNGARRASGRDSGRSRNGGSRSGRDRAQGSGAGARRRGGSERPQSSEARGESKRRTQTRGRKAETGTASAGEAGTQDLDAQAAAAGAPDAGGGVSPEAGEQKKKRRRRRRRRRSGSGGGAAQNDAEQQPDAAQADQPGDTTDAAPEGRTGEQAGAEASDAGGENAPRKRRRRGGRRGGRGRRRRSGGGNNAAPDGDTNTGPDAAAPDTGPRDTEPSARAPEPAARETE